MEFAVIKTGGKQYQVAKGDILKIEKIKGDFKAGDSIDFKEVLFSTNGKEAKFGKPLIDKAVVKGTLLEIGRAKKIDVIKYKQKSRYFKKNGHRQPFFKIRIETL